MWRLDLSTSEAVRERLQGALHRSTGLLNLDLSGVSFCDAAGLSVVVGIRNQAGARDIVIALAAPRPHVAKVLQLADLDHSSAPRSGWASMMPSV
ncbi:STAS domain-containing protein [Nonomuraea sp. NPDC023979]|uniref:STAS domain-containing protein n=1 Tax=Nonomuraea sp. NPDC023979 TaxID=3154796 RepID=UPI0033E95520